MYAIPSARDVVTRGDRLPHGVLLTRLTRHCDDRGVVAEIFRDEWGPGLRPAQWNFTLCHPNALRGVHTHLRHTDYLVVTTGEAVAALSDLRPASPTRGLSVMMRLLGDEPSALQIPPGVAHGFYYPAAATLVQAISLTFDPTDDLRCRWDDAELALDWPCDDPILSDADRDAGPLAEVRAVLASAAL